MAIEIPYLDASLLRWVLAGDVQRLLATVDAFESAIVDEGPFSARMSFARSSEDESELDEAERIGFTADVLTVERWHDGIRLGVDAVALSPYCGSMPLDKTVVIRIANAREIAHAG